MALSQESTASSGYSSLLNENVDPHYVCYWGPECNGQHELQNCTIWRSQLRGKLGIYYSPNGIYKRFLSDPISHVDLRNNPTGYTLLHLLIFTVKSDGSTEILFRLRSHRNTLSLQFPSSNPRQHGEHASIIAKRTFKQITDQMEVPQNSLKNRFLFQHANVIYPVCLTEKDATKLTQYFTPSEEYRSLHWIPLNIILERLPPWNNYLISMETTNDIAQHEHIDPVGIILDEHELWSVTATCLMCIREYVAGGLNKFLSG